MRSSTLRKERLSSLLPFLAVLAALSGLSLSCSSGSTSGIESLIDQWKLEEAQERLASLVEKDPNDIAVRRLYARVLLKRGELFSARDQYASLVILDSANTRFHRLELAFTLFYLGALDSSESIARKALSTFSERDSSAISRCYNLLGLIDFNRGRYDDALDNQRRSLLAARASSSSLAEANALRQLGVLVWYRGYADSALAYYYLPALALYRTANDKEGEATILSNIGILLNNNNSGHVSSLRYQLEAFRIRKQVGDQRGLADSYYFLTATGTGGKTLGFLYTYRMKSLELSRKIGYAWGKEVASRSLEELVPSLFLARENMAAGRDSNLSPSGEGRLYARWRRAQLYAQQRQWQAAVAEFREVLALCDSLGYVQGRHVALHQYAQVLFSLGRFAEADRMFRQAVQHNRGAPPPQNEVIELEIARTSLKLGKKEDAMRRLRSITGRLDSLYLDLIRNPGMVFSLERIAEMLHEARSSAYKLFVEAVDQNDIEEVFRLIERERALLFWGKRETMQDQAGHERDAVGLYVRLLEQLEQRPEKLEDKALLDSRISEIQESAILEERILTEAGKRVESFIVPASGKLREVLGEKEAFLQYFLAEEKVVVLVSRKGRSKVFKLPVKAGDLSAVVNVFRDLLLRGKEAPGDTLWRSPSSFLFETLLAPVERAGWIVQGDHLIISPHRALHLLPFHALLGGVPSARPFVVLERYSVSTAPSATWLVGTRGHPPNLMQNVLAAAPLGGSLPFSDLEIQGISGRAFSHVEILEPEEATAGEVLRLLPYFDVVHLATHSRMNPRYPLYSFVECYDGRLELHELFHRSGPARLAILSGCESGVGRGIYDHTYESDDVVSFPRAFVQNGVPSVISSLWLVEDRSASEVFGEFYSILNEKRNQVTLSDALTIAQRRLMAKSPVNDGQKHPFFWAPFFLFGDNR